MEDKFYTDNFEKLISGHADDFKMYPSKKAWHGIYNHLHPGTKWPSAAMTSLLLASLLIVGHLNTNNDKKQVNFAAADKIQNAVNSDQSPQRKNKNSSPSTAKIIPIDALVKSGQGQNAPDLLSLVPAIPQVKNAASSNLLASIGERNVAVASENEVYNTSEKERQQTTARYNENEAGKLVAAIEKADVEFSVELPSVDASIANPDLLQLKSSDPIKTDLASEDVKAKTIPAEELQTFNQTLLGKFFKSRKNKTSWKLYVTPNFSFRNSSGQENNSYASAAALGPVGNSPLPSKSLDHRLAIGFELGGSMLQELGRNVHLTAGLQFNYAGYNIKAYGIHPVQATIMLNNEITGQEYPHNDISNYSNIAGSNPVTLHNQQLQVSLPVGVQVKLFGDNRFQLNAGAIFQPSYVIAGVAYLPSVDNRNYLLGSELLRKWNMSTAVETFASFRAGNSLTMHIGPQVRYQLLSNYKNKYPVKEHLIDYGIKFGVSKTIK